MVFQDILCNDCDKKGNAPFHWLYHKCGFCGSYNTRVIKVNSSSYCSTSNMWGHLAFPWSYLVVLNTFGGSTSYTWLCKVTCHKNSEISSVIPQKPVIILFYPHHYEVGAFLFLMDFSNILPWGGNLSIESLLLLLKSLANFQALWVFFVNLSNVRISGALRYLFGHRILMRENAVPVVLDRLDCQYLSMWYEWKRLISIISHGDNLMESWNYYLKTKGTFLKMKTWHVMLSFHNKIWFFFFLLEIK